MELRFGSLVMTSNLLTSPLCGISNRPFRRLARRFGSALTYVEMLQTRSVLSGNANTRSLLRYYPDEKPLGAQFASSSPEELSEACKIAESLGFDTIDLNSGCPAGRVGSGLCGARLMSRPLVAARCMAAMRAAVNIPVSVKFRAGMNDQSLNYLEIGRIAQEEGMAWVTMHPRTRAQGYQGGADHSRTAELKAALRIPVFGSGDVKEPADADQLLDQYGLDGVMIGRGIFGRPWLYRQILSARAGKPEPLSPPPREVLAVLRWHFEGLLEIFDARRACILQRRYSGWYIKGIHGAAALRASFVTVETPEQFYANWHRIDQVYAAKEQAGEIPTADPNRLLWQSPIAAQPECVGAAS